MKKQINRMAPQSLKTNKPVKYIFYFLVILLYGITAYNSHGYFHGDEQYQIIEFAGLKLGTNIPDDLAWEFHEQIRPALQPALGYLFVATSRFIGVTDPYNQAFISRLLSALFSLCVITFFAQITSKRFVSPALKPSYLFLTYFLWFVPFLSVRFSSETWSGICFLLALSIYFSEVKSKALLIGIVFGLSFQFRFQMAFALVGFVAWLLFIQQHNFHFYLKIIAGFLLVTALGFLIDSWFYEGFVVTPWNYFHKNIVENVASNFGTAPWYFYGVYLFIYPNYFIGLLLLFAFAVLLVGKPKNFLLWIMLPFMLVHSLIPHKETRFLFPIVFCSPFCL